MNLKRYIDAMILRSIRRHLDWNPVQVRNGLSDLYAMSKNYAEQISDYDARKVCGRIAKFSKQAMDIMDSKSPSVTKFSSRGQSGPARWKTGAVWSHEAGPDDIAPIITTMDNILKSNGQKFAKPEIRGFYSGMAYKLNEIERNM